MWGMHIFWWVFGVILMVSFFSVMIPAPRRKAKHLYETPRDILSRRLARGEIDEQEYERRNALIERDSSQSPEAKINCATFGVVGKSLETAK